MQLTSADMPRYRASTCRGPFPGALDRRTTAEAWQPRRARRDIHGPIRERLPARRVLITVLAPAPNAVGNAPVVAPSVGRSLRTSLRYDSPGNKVARAATREQCAYSESPT